jgi:threonine dehydratase
MQALGAFPHDDIPATAARLAGVVARTPLVPFGSSDERIDLRLKLECLQETGSFKARGAWNQIVQLSEAQRKAGVVASSSGNHGKALAWAAARAGVRATIVMPENAYPNKIQACRDHGAEVVLSQGREDAERECESLVVAGATLVHPYDSARTVAGTATVGLEICEDWPEVEVVIVPVGGGGLISGVAIAVRERLGRGVTVIGVEPAGAPSMSEALALGRPVIDGPISTQVQGLCPPGAGALNVEICSKLVDHMLTLDDPEIFSAQAHLVRHSKWTVEPAGAAATACVLSQRLPDVLTTGRGTTDPLRVCAIVSGGNPDPIQLKGLRETAPDA